MDSLKKYFDNIEDKKNACHLVYEQMYWIFMKNNKQIRVNKLNAYVNFALKTLEQAEGDISEYLTFRLQQERFAIQRSFILRAPLDKYISYNGQPPEKRE